MHVDAQPILELYGSEVGFSHVPLLRELLPMMYELHVPHVSLYAELPVTPLQLVPVQTAPEVPTYNVTQSCENVQKISSSVDKNFENFLQSCLSVVNTAKFEGKKAVQEIRQSDRRIF